MPNQAAYPGHGFRGGSRMSRSQQNGHPSLPQQTLSSKQAGLLGRYPHWAGMCVGANTWKGYSPSSLQVPTALVGLKSSNSGGWLEMTTGASARAQKGKIPFPLSLSSPGAYEQSFRWPPSPSPFQEAQSNSSSGVTPSSQAEKRPRSGDGAGATVGGCGLPLRAPSGENPQIWDTRPLASKHAG